MRADTEDYKQRESRAKKLAAEIENQPKVSTSVESDFALVASFPGSTPQLPAFVVLQVIQAGVEAWNEAISL